MIKRNLNEVDECYVYSKQGIIGNILILVGVKKLYLKLLLGKYRQYALLKTEYKIPKLQAWHSLKKKLFEHR